MVVWADDICVIEQEVGENARHQMNRVLSWIGDSFAWGMAPGTPL